MHPGEYAAVFNVDLKYTLNNKAGVVGLLFAPDGVAASSVELLMSVEYSDPEEAESYAYFAEDDAWVYTVTPTPGAVNVRTLQEEDVEVVAACVVGQFRNPAMGRCKKIEVAVAQVPCKVGQYRSQETGRCRNTATASTPAPCKVGQERNLETGRCRNIKKMTDAANAPIPKPEVTAGGVAWYAWVFAGVIIVVVLGYAVWEWREEIRPHPPEVQEVAYTKGMRILGIDPGTGIMGFGVIDVVKGSSFSVVDAGVIKTPAHTPQDERLEDIYHSLMDIIAATKPDVCSIEKLFFVNNITTAMSVSEARGVALLAARLNKMPIYEYTPMQIKQTATGYGKADKKQVQEMVRIHLGLREVPKPDDCADALAAALTHAMMHRV